METKIKIIDILEKRKNGVYFREMSRLLKTGLNNIQQHIKLLEKEGIINKEKKGNLLNVCLKPSQRTEAYLKQVHTERFAFLPKKVQIAVKDFLNELRDKPLIALIFGSYAKNTFNEESNLDILLIFQKVEKTKNIEDSAKKISMRSNIKMRLIYLEYADFEKNFLNKEHEFSNEIRKETIIILGIELYYSLLWRFLK